MSNACATHSLTRLVSSSRTHYRHVSRLSSLTLIAAATVVVVASAVAVAAVTLAVVGVS